MNKEDFIKYLEEFISAKSLKPKTLKVFKFLIRKIKPLNDYEYAQFLEIMCQYADDVNNEIHNMLEEAYSRNNQGKDYDTGDPELDNVYKLIDGLKKQAEELGIDMEMVEVGPNEAVSNTFPTSSKRSGGYGNPVYDKDVNFIPRRPLCVNITNSEFRINPSFMNYLKEIWELKNSAPIINPYMDDQSDDDDDIGITIGYKDDKIIITLIAGVNNFETFYVFETDNGSGLMYCDDFKYFKERSKNDVRGIYKFELGENKQYFIGSKYIQNV